MKTVQMFYCWPTITFNFSQNCLAQQHISHFSFFICVPELALLTESLISQRSNEFMVALKSGKNPINHKNVQHVKKCWTKSLTMKAYICEKKWHYPLSNCVSAFKLWNYCCLELLRDSWTACVFYDREINTISPGTSRTAPQKRNSVVERIIAGHQVFIEKQVC